jgi:hypothetical protein
MANIHTRVRSNSAQSVVDASEEFEEDGNMFARMQRYGRFGYSGPQKMDHSGHLHLLKLFPFQPP